MRKGLLGRIRERTLQQQINVQNPPIVVDSSIAQITTSSYPAGRPPKHDTISFAPNIVSGICEEITNTNLSSSDTDSDDD